MFIGFLANMLEGSSGAFDLLQGGRARVSGVGDLGAGVAFTVESNELNLIREGLRRDFIHWLGSQDMQTWRPHITIQNKASVAKANRLHRELSGDFHAYDITIVGLDLWRYLDGPWAHEATVPFVDCLAVNSRSDDWDPTSETSD